MRSGGREPFTFQPAAGRDGPVPAGRGGGGGGGETPPRNPALGGGGGGPPPPPGGGGPGAAGPRGGGGPPPEDWVSEKTRRCRWVNRAPISHCPTEGDELPRR